MVAALYFKNYIFPPNPLYAVELCIAKIHLQKCSHCGQTTDLDFFFLTQIAVFHDKCDHLFYFPEFSFTLYYSFLDF